MSSNTRDKQIENCLLALWRWSEVEPKHVVSRLSTWKCGTQACFGGHLLHWPEFTAQGVHQHSRSDGPAITEDTDTFAYADSMAAAVTLFGHPKMFAERGDHYADEPCTSDHAIVADRLEQRISELCA